MVKAIAVTACLIAAGVSCAVALDATPAEARGFVAVGIGVPLFPPYYAYPPPPVVYAPPPMVYAAPPVVVSQPTQYWYFRRGLPADAILVLLRQSPGLLSLCRELPDPVASSHATAERPTVKE